jgi:hypothetical protein
MLFPFPNVSGSLRALTPYINSLEKSRMLLEVLAALRFPAFSRAQNAAGIRGVLKQAEHLQPNCARCRQLRTSAVNLLGFQYALVAD